MNLMIKLSRMLAVCAVVTLLPAAALAADTRLSDTQIINASEASQSARPDFGRRVSVFDDLMVVGTGLGEALIYRQQSDRSWAYEATLTHPSGSADFGIDVATDGTFVAVLDTTQGVRIYKPNSSGWVYETTVNLTATGRTFRRLDLIMNPNGADLAVTCFSTQTPNGPEPQIFMIDRIWHGGWFTWDLIETLTNPSTASDNFGASIDLDLGRLLVGDPFSSNSKAYVFDEDQTDGTWFLEVTLDPTITLPSSFGYAVALHGDHAIVSAVGWNVSSNADQGIALLFKKNSANLWGLAHSFTPSCSDCGGFGSAVGISGETVLITSIGKPTHNFGSGFGSLFRERGGTWYELANLTPASTGNSFVNYHFGRSLSLSDNTAVFGADGGEHISGLSFPGRVHAFDIDVRWAKFWTGAQDSDIGEDENWEGASGTDAFFTNNTNVNGDQMATMDGTTWLYEMVTRVNTVINLNNQSSTVGDGFSTREAFSVYGSTGTDGAVSTLVGPGTLDLQHNARVGRPDRFGQLTLRNGAEVEIDSFIYINDNGAVAMDINDTATPLVARGGSIGGGLTVTQPDNLTVALGDSFDLLRMTDAAPPAGNDAFATVMLPIVGENLGLELSYDGGNSAGYLTVTATAIAMDDLVEFDPPQTITESSLALDMVNADIDGDGADEVCVLYAGTPGTVGIYSSSANGLVLQHTLNTGDGPRDITHGDFNDDGYQDLAVANTGDGDITVFVGTGILTSFTTDTFAPSEGRPECISRTDWDGVGGDDLVAGLRVQDPNGEAPDTGAFEIFTYSSNFGPGGGMGGGGANGSPGGVPSVFGDPSDDEDQKDLPFSAGDDEGNAVGGRGGSGLTSDMVFEIVQVGADITSLSMRDLDGDGEKDLVIAVASTDTLAMIKGGTNGSIETNNPVYLPAAGADPASLVADDLNGDAKIDLAWIQTDALGYRVMQIAQNNGDFSFTALAPGSDPVNFLMAADITGSGTLDMLTMETGSSGLLSGFANLSLLEQPDGVCKNGDADGNGIVNIEDLLIVIGEWNQTCDLTNPCTADFDNNGIINIEDLLIVIGYYGPC